MTSANTEHCSRPYHRPAEKHALIIEDFPIIAMSIHDELAEMGYSPTIAATEGEAIALAEKHCPDLIIADLRLAQGSGIDAVRRICRGRPIAVIFMSGDDEAIDNVATGEASFLSKPFTSTALRSVIDTAGPMCTG
jgi:CheY-like chemotaxis protein